MLTSSKNCKRSISKNWRNWQEEEERASLHLNQRQRLTPTKLSAFANKKRPVAKRKPRRKRSDCAKKN